MWKEVSFKAKGKEKFAPGKERYLVFTHCPEDQVELVDVSILNENNVALAIGQFELYEVKAAVIECERDRHPEPPVPTPVIDGDRVKLGQIMYDDFKHQYQNGDYNEEYCYIHSCIPHMARWLCELDQMIANPEPGVNYERFSQMVKDWVKEKTKEINEKYNEDV